MGEVRVWPNPSGVSGIADGHADGRHMEQQKMSALFGVFATAMLSIFGIVGGLFQQALAF